jgi:hypothetical protein
MTRINAHLLGPGLLRRDRRRSQLGEQVMLAKRHRNTPPSETAPDRSDEHPFACDNVGADHHAMHQARVERAPIARRHRSDRAIEIDRGRNAARW